MAAREASKGFKRVADPLHLLRPRDDALKTDPVFNVPTWDGQARDVAFVWRLRKGRKLAECRLVTHPVGGEIRIVADGEFVRSAAGRDPLVLMELATAWKVRFEEMGWAGAR